VKKKFGPITITNEEKMPDIESDNVFLDQMMKALGVCFLLLIGMKSIRHEQMETYSSVAGWLMIACALVYLFRKIKEVKKEDITRFTNRFFWVKKDNKDGKE
jgi:Ca2+/Na+ antiporter